MKRSVRKRIGALYEELSVDRMSHRVIVLTGFLRRINIIYLIMQLSHLPGIQVMI
jgi:hypothetical protein